MSRNILLKDKRTDEGLLFDFYLRNKSLNATNTQIDKICNIPMLKELPIYDYFVLFLRKKLFHKMRFNINNDYISNIYTPINKIFGADLLGRDEITQEFKVRGLIRNIYYFVNNIIIYILKKSIIINNNYKFNIGICYEEGMNNNKKSDIFWYDHSKINPQSILIYISNPFIIRKYEKPFKVINKIEKAGFNWICTYPSIKYNYWKYIKYKNDQLQMIINCINLFKPTNKIERWIKKQLKFTIKRIEFWQSFFKSHNIFIHYDVTESNYENIFKNMALDLLGGCSVGKERSLVSCENSRMIGYYPNHVFFTWGSKSAKNYLKTFNTKKNIIISGFPFCNADSYDEIQTECADTLKKNGANFIILLLDNKHQNNETWYQNVYTPIMFEFYRYFLDWIFDDPDIGLIIKSKRPVIQESLPGIHELINQAESTGRCYNVPIPFGYSPSNFAEIATLAVSTNIFMSSALIECVLSGCRGVHYDYANLKTIETDLYGWGENRIIFPELDTMVSAIKTFKNDPSINPQLGDWSEHIDELDPFRDNRGGERIGTYMRWLQEGFEKGLDRDKSIDRANSLYAKDWGMDKIYYSERPVNLT